MEFSPKLVCDWLLHRGYKLTALELLVESEQAGKLDEVVDLQVRQSSFLMPSSSVNTHSLSCSSSSVIKTGFHKTSWQNIKGRMRWMCRRWQEIEKNTSR